MNMYLELYLKYHDLSKFKKKCIIPRSCDTYNLYYIYHGCLNIKLPTPKIKTVVDLYFT